MIKICWGDCLHVMSMLEDNSVDMILTDLPYGTTYASWDSCIPLDKLWALWLRIVKPQAAIVLTASQPFTSQLIMSKPELFRCEWIWDKVNAANFPNANKQPLKVHENVLVFSQEQPVYNPQKTLGAVNHKQGSKARQRVSELDNLHIRAPDDPSGLKFPKSIQTFPKHSSQSKLHSTQKPVELFEYLIRTYSNENAVILDCTAGSGTTGEAARNAGRKAILIDNKFEYVEIMCARLPGTQFIDAQT